MAKNNRINRQQGKSAYIERNINKNGYNFMALKTPTEMYREMPIILRELANQNISLDQYGGMFLYNQFTTSCIDYCEKQISLIDQILKGLSAMYTCGWMDQLDWELYNKMTVKRNMYGLIMNTVICCRNYNSYEPMRGLQQELNCKYRDYIQSEVKL